MKYRNKLDHFLGIDSREQTYSYERLYGSNTIPLGAGYGRNDLYGELKKRRNYR